jgi:hypothetical protein
MNTAVPPNNARPDAIRNTQQIIIQSFSMCLYTGDDGGVHFFRIGATIDFGACVVVCNRDFMIRKAHTIQISKV